MASKNYLPTPDQDLLLFLANFVAVAGAAPGDFGLTAAQISALVALQGAYGSGVDDHNAAALAAKTARQARDTAKKAVAAEVRRLVRIVQSHPGLTDAQRESLKITVPKADKTPVPVPDSRPLPKIEDVDELEHVIRLFDDESNRAAKPDGVDGAEVYMKIVPQGGPAPVNVSEMSYAGTVSNTKLTKTFEPEDAGKTVYYRCRWVNTKNQPGQFGPQVSATVAA